MSKTVSKLGEEGKVAIRNVRRDAMKTIEKLEKDGSISGAAAAGQGVRQMGRRPCRQCFQGPLSVSGQSWGLAVRAHHSNVRDGPPLAEDQRKGMEAAVQKLTDDYVKQIDGLIKSKSDELTKV